MTLLNGLFSTLGTALVAAFGPAIGALATVISVQIPAAALAVGVTLGLLVTPVAALLSIGADKLSNLWATWIESGPIGRITSSTEKEGVELRVELSSITPPPFTFNKKTDNLFSYTTTNDFTLVVSPKALQLGGDNSHLQQAVVFSGDKAESCFNAAAKNSRGMRFPTAKELEVTPVESVFTSTGHRYVKF